MISIDVLRGSSFAFAIKPAKTPNASTDSSSNTSAALLLPLTSFPASFPDTARVDRSTAVPLKSGIT
jgi:hypothetical protein